jgi:carbonic anhydrase
MRGQTAEYFPFSRNAAKLQYLPMRLFEAIIDANQRATGPDAEAHLSFADNADHLPVVALTCIDPRLNHFFPGVLGLDRDQFIWLRTAGNVITDPMSSTVRSLALACALKGGREIAIIGHSDCAVRKTNPVELNGLFKNLGINRNALPGDLSEYFGLFKSERENVFTAANFVRRSPLIGPKIPVHGLMIETSTGRLEWVVNGYDVLGHPAMPVLGLRG